MKYLLNRKYPLILILVVLSFFSPFWILGKLPIPSDSLVGMYHPWRDSMNTEYPRGFPYKNPLITDPIRQQFPYRILAINLLKQGKYPNWNPYSFAGTPLLDNIQTAVFYPLNLLFFILNAQLAWSILVILQPLLTVLFTFLYLKNLKLSNLACFLGSISFAFSGFMMSWMTWNTIGHVALWLPLILLAKDELLKKFNAGWAAVLVFAEMSVIFAGHLQTAFYVILFSSCYLFIRAWKLSSGKFNQLIILLKPFIFTSLLVLLFTSIQVIPTVNFIIRSSRNFDLLNWDRIDWFLPWAHLLQFIAPDFFGNPATGNYWGIWNYGEFVGYIGMFPLMAAIIALITRRDNKTLFYGLSLLFFFIIILPTFFAKLPYIFKIPFVSTLQPSRIMVLIDFSLSILAALGFDTLLNEKGNNNRIIRLIKVFILIFIALWVVVLFAKYVGISFEMEIYLNTAVRNLLVPTVLFFVSSIIIILYIINTQEKVRKFLILLTLLMVIFDLNRFFHKFTPFSDQKLLFAQTATTNFLQQNLGYYRFMSTDRKIMPPNVSLMYKLSDIDGYDPLYLKTYGEFVAAWTRDKPDTTPASFNRILTPENYDSFLADLIGVKYVLSLKDVKNSKLKLVFQEGETRIYENTNVFPRAFFVESVVNLSNKKDVMKRIFENQKELLKFAFTESNTSIQPAPFDLKEQVTIIKYEENQVIIKTSSQKDRLLILTDIYYPSWKVFIDSKISNIFLVDYIFRGVEVPQGEHIVEFKI